jgi:hypothetical protein
VGRVAFRADERLQERLDNVLEAMRKSPVLKHMDVTPSLVIKAALGYGLPFLESEFASKTFGDDGETVESWLNSIGLAVARMQDKLDEHRSETLMRTDSGERSEKKTKPGK